MTDMVRMDVEGGIAVVRIDNPPVNALSRGVRDGLHAAVAAADAAAAAQAILIVCEGRTYIAGADIREFGKPMQGTSLFDVQAVLEGASKPIISSIHGNALGGGLETAMCCHYRVALATARFGQPEVKLGVPPGAGGTQRLPRLVGVERALEMMVSGRMVDADFALEHGLIDAIIDEVFEGGVAFARKVVDEGWPLARVRDLDDKIEEAKQDPELFDRFRRSIARKTRGFEAPEAIVQCVEDAVAKPFDEAIRSERERFEKLLGGEQSAAQRHYFFAERAAGKVPDIPRDTAKIPVNKVGVIGAGTMGGAISMNFLNRGVPVTIVETGQEALDRGLGVVRDNYERTAKRGRISAAQVQERMEMLASTLALEDLSDCDLIIEAVFENLDLKQEIFAKLDGLAKDGAILATNTSALDVDAIAAMTERPEMVVGMHFFSPANIMRLLEVVRAKHTSDEVMATVMAMAKHIGKVAVVSGVCSGFIGNRMLFQRSNQADRMVFAGPSPEDIDRVNYEFGMPMGPFAMADLAGLDIHWDGEVLEGRSFRERLCAMGRRGQKTGAGYYNYDPQTRARSAEPEVQKLILELSEALGKTRREFSDEEILQRSLYPLINEGAKILEEGISSRPGDIDVVWVCGYGWPVYRGGPMFYADSIGLPTVLEALKRFEQQDEDDFWRPAALLEQLVADDKGFADLVS